MFFKVYVSFPGQELRNIYFSLLSPLLDTHAAISFFSGDCGDVEREASAGCFLLQPRALRPAWGLSPLQGRAHVIAKETGTGLSCWMAKHHCLTQPLQDSKC